MSQQLNYKIQGEGHTIVLIHGLFGNLDNLGLLARDLVLDHQVLSVDLRNHGQSFHSQTHDYASMAKDIVELLSNLGIKTYTLVGHSMGGKVAMQVANLSRQNTSALIVLDMAPVQYHQRRHDDVFAGLFAVLDHKPVSRKEAMAILEQHIDTDGVRQFLSKSLYKEGQHMTWRFNVHSLYQNYMNILAWETQASNTVPTLFIKGANSDYLTPEYQPQIQAQYPIAKAHVIANTGHWLHAEKPAEVLRVMRRFLSK